MQRTEVHARLRSFGHWLHRHYLGAGLSAAALMLALFTALVVGATQRAAERERAALASARTVPAAPIARTSAPPREAARARQAGPAAVVATR